MNNQAILVTGGAGYIAAPSVFLLLQQNYQVIVIDQRPAHYATYGYGKAMAEAGKLVTFTADFADEAVLQKIIRTYPIAACMHFAAFIEVGASVEAPAAYYENNVTKSITLLNCLRTSGITRIIFSSSCAVYGIPQGELTENHPRNPISPYGRTKMMFEMVLQDYAHAYGLQYAILRYFNAAGGVPEHNLYERHEPESHVIPKVFEAARMNKPITIFGADYATPDGTCIRDYVHIQDLAQAHYKALCYLLATDQSIICNIGTGTGYSVEEIITMVEQVTNKKIVRLIAPRRKGDPARLVAKPDLAQQLLQWQPQYSTLRHIIESAYAPYLQERHEAPNQVSSYSQTTDTTRQHQHDASSAR